LCLWAPPNERPKSFFLVFWSPDLFLVLCGLFVPPARRQIGPQLLGRKDQNWGKRFFVWEVLAFGFPGAVKRGILSAGPVAPLESETIGKINVRPMKTKRGFLGFTPLRRKAGRAKRQLPIFFKGPPLKRGVPSWCAPPPNVHQLQSRIHSRLGPRIIPGGFFLSWWRWPNGWEGRFKGRVGPPALHHTVPPQTQINWTPQPGPWAPQIC